MRAVIAAALAVGCLLSKAHARDLWAVSTGEKTASFIDLDSLRQTGKARREAWIDSYEGLQNPAVYLSQRALREFDCAKDRMRILSIIVYESDGGVEDTAEGEGDWKRIAPGTVGESWSNFVCATEEERQKIGFRVVAKDVEAWAAILIHDIEP